MQRESCALWLTLFIIAALAAMPAAARAEAPTAPPAAAAAAPAPPPPENLEKWRAMRFGMFIHWGPVSLKGTEIGWSRGAQVPIEEYDNLYKQFNPTKFNADEWVRTAKDAGMKYLVITSKHHDGFCIFNTRETDFNIMNSPFGRDPLKELSEACRKQDIAFGTYYSVCDWHHPDFPRGSPGGKTLKPNPNLDRYEQYLRNQVQELIRQYGPLLVLWFDVPQEFKAERGKGVVDFVRSLQPGILINNRCANPGDFDTPEQRVGTLQTKRPWETCMTICHQWAWKPDDKMKSLKECLDVLVRCAGGDGNLLFNVGPMPTGEIEPRQVERLKEMGRWMARYGQTLYGTRGGPYRPGPWGATTSKGNTLYVHILKWEGDTITLPAIDRKVLSSSVLTGGKAGVRQTAEGIEISVAPADRQELDTLVVLTLDGPAFDATVQKTASASVARGGKASASNVFQKNAASYGPDKAFDDDPGTRWAADAGTREAWLAVDLGSPQTIDRAALSEFAPRIQEFVIEYQKDGQWQAAARGKRAGEDFEMKFTPVTAQVWRLNILKASDGPTIWEFQLFAAKTSKSP
ncbi:MAG: alpha-L-fucosidase [Planctomycetota bacterium]|nr:alpha-L-fucosidase [Planctomycetota bacterium]